MKPFLDVAAWVGPVGFLRRERETESRLGHGSDVYDVVAMYGLLLVADLLTLPLAVLSPFVGRDENRTA